MNIIIPDQLYELNRQKIQRDRAFILKEEMLKPRSNFGVMLNALGAWMIARGERLRKRYSISPRTSPLTSLKDVSIFKA